MAPGSFSRRGTPEGADRCDTAGTTCRLAWIRAVMPPTVEVLTGLHPLGQRLH